jgi:phosphate transport system permease protein
MNNIKLNRNIDTAFKYVGIFCTFSGIAILVIFIGNILADGLTRINWDFITNLPSRRASKAGILPAWAGTTWILGLTAMIAIPVGIAAGIYLQEYGRKNRLARIVELNIANLAGVPSIIYGLLGLEIFVRILNFGGSLLAGAFTLSLLILPIIIVATREALKL